MLKTAESVCCTHPDSTSDYLADSILDSYLKEDKYSRCAVEVFLTYDLVVLGGEITSTANVNREEVVRKALCDLGYDRDENNYNGRTIKILDKIHSQSLEIAKAVIIGEDDMKASDQGIMHSSAVNDNDNLMFLPMPNVLALELVANIQKDIDDNRKDGKWESCFLPDGKTQTIVQYNSKNEVERIDSIVVSVCHKPFFTIGDIRNLVYEKVIIPLKNKYSSLFDENTKLYINQAGTWNVGGPCSDCGLTGRKIVCNSGGCGSGGGAFSGKDFKVDRIAPMALRHIAKNIVASGIAKKAELQCSYVIGKAEPLSVYVKADGLKISQQQLEELVNKIDLTPNAIIKRFDLRRPIYAQVAKNVCHFGNPEFPWEKLDLVEYFKQ